MCIEKIIKERCSVRGFLDKKISKKVINEIIDVVRLSPTALNNQPYNIYIVQSEEGLQKIKKAFAPDYNANTILVVCSDKNKSWANRYSGQNNVLQDIGVVAATILYTSKAKGIDSCYVCNFDPNILHSQLNLADNIYPECLIYLGYPDANFKPSERHYQRRNIKEFVNYL